MRRAAKSVFHGQSMPNHVQLGPHLPAVRPRVRVGRGLATDPHSTAERLRRDIILVGLRDYQDDKADVIPKYMLDEARLLKAYGELPLNIRLNEGIASLEEDDEGAADDYLEFEDEDID